MKIIVLVDGSTGDFENMVNLVDSKNIFITSTENCDAPHEYKYLTSAIQEFSNSGNDVMLGKFSGREDIVRELGDERPEMIVTISYNTNSQYYSGCPVTTFTDLIKTFEKETI